MPGRTCSQDACERGIADWNTTGRCRDHRHIPVRLECEIEDCSSKINPANNTTGRCWKHSHADYLKEWNAANPDKVKQYGRNGAARRRKLMDPVDRWVVYERDGGICHICLEMTDPRNWHMDHVIPLARGGAHAYDNVAVSHPACNIAKGDKI